MLAGCRLVLSVRTMIRQCVNVLAFMLLGLSCGDWMNAGTIRLGLREARILVEHTPVFLRAVETGLCPETSDGNVEGDVATVIIRRGCKRFDWIGGLYVNLSTGIVTKDGGASGPIVIENPELAELRKELFAQREEFRLTASEAICLLSKTEIAPAADACRRINVSPQDDGVFLGAIEDTCSKGVRGEVGEVIVDRYSRVATDARTRKEFKSRAFEEMRQQLLTSRSPARLSVEEARSFGESGPVSSS